MESASLYGRLQVIPCRRTSVTDTFLSYRDTTKWQHER